MDDILNRPLNITGLRDTMDVLHMKKKEDFPYLGIWICSGAQGAGKTLFAVHLLRDIYKDYPNVKIYSNVALFGLPYTPYTGIECFEDENGKDGIIYLIDEVHTLYSSLESKNMSGSYLTVWSQNRKNRRLILGTSQRWTRVAKPIREQAIWNIECKRTFLPFLYLYRPIDATMYDDQGNYIGEKHLFYKFYFPNALAMLSYDTLEVVKKGDSGLKNG